MATEAAIPVNLDPISQKTQDDLPSPNSDSGVGISTETTPSEESNPITNVDSQQSVSGITVQLDKPSNGSVAPQSSKEAEGPHGPDYVIPSESYIAWDRNAAVKLHMSESGPLSETPISVPTMMLNTVRRVPDNLAIAVKRGPTWTRWTYRQYYDDVVRVAKSFIKLGLQPTHGVGIIGFNSPEWFLSDLGAIFAGGFAVGIYTTNNPEACLYVAKDANCDIIVAENDQQLQKFLKIRDQLPGLKAIIQYTGTLKEKYENVYTWDEFMEFGNSVGDEVLRDRIYSQAPNKCCTLIYTSGTTGNPKGVMLSHDNITWTAYANIKASKLQFGNEVGVSYLPVSHVAAQLFDLHIPIALGSTVYFARPDALKGTLGDTLREVRPTVFFGVPRVWEKMQEKMLEIGRQTKGLKRSIANWAKDIGLRGNLSLQNGGSLPWGFSVANALVYKKIRAALGLDRCHIILSGAAPIMRETLEYFMSLNIVINEVYGMSECSGPHTVGLPNTGERICSVGREFNGATTRFHKQDEDGAGEVCMFGRHVMMGYLGNEEKTREALDDDGLLHSGDIGRRDKDGFMFITGRIKEIIITAGGENVAPVLIEDNVKEALPVVSNCMLIGDKKKFLSMLITLKTEVNPDTLEPQPQLTQAAQIWCKEQGSSSTTISQILDGRDENVLKAIQAGIDKANKKSVSRAQVIQKWSILPRDFSIPGGELGPTMKVKRPIINKMYKNTIDAFYTGS